MRLLFRFPYRPPQGILLDLEHRPVQVIIARCLHCGGWGWSARARAGPRGGIGRLWLRSRRRRLCFGWRWCRCSAWRLRWAVRSRTRSDHLRSAEPIKCVAQGLTWDVVTAATTCHNQGYERETRNEGPLQAPWTHLLISNQVGCRNNPTDPRNTLEISRGIVVNCPHLNTEPTTEDNSWRRPNVYHPKGHAIDDG